MRKNPETENARSRTAVLGLLATLVLGGCGSSPESSRTTAGGGGPEDASADAATSVTGSDAASVTFSDATSVTGADAGAPNHPPVSFPLHVPTVDYGDGAVNSATTRVYNAPDMQYLSLAQISTPSVATQFHDHGVLVEYYVYGFGVVAAPKPQDPYFGDLGGVAGSTTVQASPGFAHDCPGNLLRSEESADWLMVDWTLSSTTAAFRKAYLDPTVMAGDPIDFLYIDGPTDIAGAIDTVTGSIEYKDPAHVAPCVNGSPSTEDSWSQAVQAQLAQLGKPVITDSAGDTKAYSAAVPQSIVDWTTVAGERSECTYVCHGDIPGSQSAAPDWEGHENVEILLVNDGRIEIIQNSDDPNLPTSPAGQQNRLFGFASILLTYSLQTTYSWYLAAGAGIDQDPKNPSGERLYPEYGLVPLNPVVPEPASYSGMGSSTGIYQLRATGGAYYREYADCGYRGERVGRCIVAVNPDTKSSVPFPVDGYVTGAGCHQLALHNGPGAEIQNGGTVTFDGPPAPATMTPSSAYIVVDTQQ